MQMDVKIKSTTEFTSGGSEKYVMDGIASFQVWLVKNPCLRTTITFGGNSDTNSSGQRVYIFVKFIEITKCTPICIKFSSVALGIKDLCISADSIWHLITDKYVTISEFSVYFTVEIQNNHKDKLNSLYLASDSGDFELRADDGSVRVHKFMLAAISPVFETMLQGDWKETKNGYVHLEGMSKASLQEFKQYIYFNTLPTTVSKETMIIANRYEIPDMETISIKNLIANMKAENVCDLLEFAVTHKYDRLRKVILERVQKGFIQVDKMRKTV